MAAKQQQEPRRRNDTRDVLTAVFLSLALHAAVVFWLIKLEIPGPPPDPPRLVLELRATLPAAPEPEADQETPPESSESRLQPDTAATAPQRIPEEPLEPVIGQVPLDEPIVSPDVRDLRRQILELARVKPRLPETGDGPVADPGTPLRHARAPRLPGAPGWLDRFIGPVTPSADSWRDEAGDHRGRFVTASGQVFCTRRAMPTTEEFFQPWKYAGVTMSWACGRERPPPPDPDDPWIRRPAKPSP